MLRFPNISPDIVSFKLFGMPLSVRWYGLLYVIGFVLGYILYKPFLKKKDITLKREEYESALFYVMLGVILGGRLGYVLFYNLGYYISHPQMIFAVWEGGMSFHGGVLGVIIAGLIFCKRYRRSFFAMADAAIPIICLGLGLGRLGNFINGELWGRVTTLPWGMVFPDGGDLPRHPTQIYEMLSEGLILFVLTYILLNKKLKDGVVFWSFIGGYGIIRFLIEFIRVPDDLVFYDKYGYILGFMSIGQFLSLLMIIASILGIIFLNRRKS